MPFKYLLIIIPLSFFTLSAFAQKQNVYYLKNDGKQVSTKDSADYIRILSEPDSGSFFFNVKEYYVNGKLKLIGKSSKVDYNSLEGQSLSFYANGKRKLVANYEYGLIKGEAYEYYPNGVLYREIEPANYGPLENDNQFYNVNQLQDSTGKILLTNNTGYYINYQADFKGILEEGKLKKGVRDSVWKGSNIIGDSVITFTERYNDGRIVEGSSQSVTGKIYKYTNREVAPEFKGGQDEFGKYIAYKLTYPERAKRDNIQGRVFIQFVIEKNGSLTEFKIIREPGYGLGEEALRVIKRSPKWVPGFQYGRPVRVSFTVPVAFSLPPDQQQHSY